MGGVIRNKVAVVYSGAFIGFDGSPIEVEADMKAGLPQLQIVGMGNKAIDEARQRVRSAISNSLLEFPAQKVVINLAPAELPKYGTHLDLPIALSILTASGQLRPQEVAEGLFAGELALDGSLRPIRGAVVLAEIAKRTGKKRLYVPHQNVPQAALVEGIEIVGITSLQELYKGLKHLTPLPCYTPDDAASSALSTPSKNLPLFSAIIGQPQAKRALAIAAAGRHSILLSGSPGAGKTMLARALQELLPPLSPEEVLEVTKLHSLASGDDTSVQLYPPFRSPHHSVTLTALIGGGLKPRPGDISLAHKGVLFLDELPEFPRSTLEALRQPLEDRIVHLSRLYGRISWPADSLLVATMNPCPCGYLGDALVPCTCSMTQIQHYKGRISGPVLDRIDMRLTIAKTSHEHFFDAKSLKNNQHIKVLDSIKQARAMQQKRYNRSDIYNAYASFQVAKTQFKVTAEAKSILDAAATKLQLSSRGYLRTLRVARTIADLQKSPTVSETHISEALQYRG